MHYKKFPPSEAFAPFVDFYFEWEGEVAERVEVQSPPANRVAIVFNYGDPTKAYQNAGPEVEVPEAFVCGLFTSNYHRVLQGKVGMFGIVFRPYGIHNLFNVRMSTLVNNRMPLELLLAGQSEELLGQVKKASNADERKQVCEQFLLPLMAEGKQHATIIDDVVDWIDNKKGQVTVEEAATEFKVSKRYIEKQFLVKVGVSPKFYARVRRFMVVSLKVAYSSTMDWHDAVIEGGYHDQSHMVKEFIEFNQQTPGEYLEGHQEMTRFVRKT